MEFDFYPDMTPGPKPFEQYLIELDLNEGRAGQTIHINPTELFRIISNFGISRLYYGPAQEYGFEQTGRLNFDPEGKVSTISQSGEGQELFILLNDSMVSDLLGSDLSFDFPFGLNQLQASFLNGDLVDVGYGIFGGVAQYLQHAKYKEKFRPDDSSHKVVSGNSGGYDIAFEYTAFEDSIRVEGVTIDQSGKLADDHVIFQIPRKIDTEVIVSSLVSPELRANPTSPDTRLDRSWIGVDFRKLFGIKEILPPELERLFAR